MDKKIIIGSRGSKLALWQAHYVQSLLTKQGIDSEINIIKTKGDNIQHLSFDKIEGKGFFTKEIEEALLNKKIDLAVHSYKDLPTENPKGLILAGNSYRADCRDCIIINKKLVDGTRELSLPFNAVTGTSSARRKSQLLAIRPDLKLQDIRGNVPTRLSKLDNGNFDAVVLAAAGLERLAIDLSAYHVEYLSPQICIPAPAQGVLAYQIRSKDSYLRSVVESIHDSDVAKCVYIERAILQKLGGGCQQPIGVYCEMEKGDENTEQVYHVWASHAKKWDDFPKRIFMKGTDAETLITNVCWQLNELTTKKKFSYREV